MDKKILNDIEQNKSAKWYEGKNKEIVIYYLIAVFFLEIIVGTAAFFYGVANAKVLVEGGPKLASFPWVGWSISATLTPVCLLLLFHLSGWFFSRSLQEDRSSSKDSQNTANNAQIPKNVELFYSVVSNAPVIVILLGLIALGGVLFFLDTVLGTLRPYIPWILGSATVFLIVCYIARLIFLARHHKLEQEYAYRMRIFEQTGVIITEKTCIPITAEQIASHAAALKQNLSLPENSGKSDDTSGKESENNAKNDDIVDANIVDVTTQDDESISNNKK